MPTCALPGSSAPSAGRGGYRLNKAPEEITLERVVRLFQGQLAPIGYATRRNPTAPKFVADSLGTWGEVRDATIEILEDDLRRPGEARRGQWRKTLDPVA